jgi:hypothetical protein
VVIKAAPLEKWKGAQKLGEQEKPQLCPCETDADRGRFGPCRRGMLGARQAFSQRRRGRTVVKNTTGIATSGRMLAQTLFLWPRCGNQLGLFLVPVTETGWKGMAADTQT